MRNKGDCRWCAVYAYLEHGSFQKKINYLCRVARASRNFKNEWLKKHRRYYKIAGMTIQVDSDLPFKKNTFDRKFQIFRTNKAGSDNIRLQHHFTLPEFNIKEIGRQVYRKAPWAIYEKNNAWTYLGISPFKKDKVFKRVVFFNPDHTRATIYNLNDNAFRKGGMESLTLFPTDQILLARVLADRRGFYLHSSGVIMRKKGLLFAGQSGAGKSTISRLLSKKAEILCDDRIIIRNTNGRFEIFGTWSHGDVAQVSGKSAPLEAIFFLKKSIKNQIIPLRGKDEAVCKVMNLLVRPFVTVDWWQKVLTVVDELVQQVPCYLLKFDRSAKATRMIESFVHSRKTGEPNFHEV